MCFPKVSIQTNEVKMSYTKMYRQQKNTVSECKQIQTANLSSVQSIIYSNSNNYSSVQYPLPPSAS